MSTEPESSPGEAVHRILTQLGWVADAVAATGGEKRVEDLRNSLALAEELRGVLAGIDDAEVLSRTARVERMVASLRDTLRYRFHLDMADLLRVWLVWKQREGMLAAFGDLGSRVAKMPPEIRAVFDREMKAIREDEVSFPDLYARAMSSADRWETWWQKGIERVRSKWEPEWPADYDARLADLTADEMLAWYEEHRLATEDLLAAHPEWGADGAGGGDEG
jgi:hypothetical protein